MAQPASRAVLGFEGDDVTGLPPHARVRRGISLVPEGLVPPRLPECVIVLHFWHEGRVSRVRDGA